MTSRINGVFGNFKKNKDISPIIDQIERMKKEKSEWWWAYWNNDKLEESLQGKINRSVAKYLLWKYEVHLEQQGKAGYSPTRYDKIESPSQRNAHLIITSSSKERFRIWFPREGYGAKKSYKREKKKLSPLLWIIAN